MKQIQRLPFLFALGGSVYYSIEMISRGYSHWTMFCLGGLCFMIMGILKNIKKIKYAIFTQAVISACAITILEFITGYIVNIRLGLNVWDYSREPFNLMGQVCLQFTFIWFFLSIAGILLNDLIQFVCFEERMTHYKVLDKGSQILLNLKGTQEEGQ